MKKHNKLFASIPFAFVILLFCTTVKIKGSHCLDTTPGVFYAADGNRIPDWKIKQIENLYKLK